MSHLILASMPNFTFLTLIVKKPVLILAGLPVVAIAPVVDFLSLVTVLFWLFVVDFITGLLASYFVWKEKAEKNKFFFGVNQGYTSDKFKKCVIKGMAYGGLPLIVAKFQDAFMLKTFSVSYITEARIDLTTVMILLFCLNEVYSIIWENLPKCGLDVPKSINNIWGVVKTAKNEINEN